MKTGDVYKQELKNSNLTYERAIDSKLYHFINGYLVDAEGVAVSPNIKADEDWKLVPVAVDFLTAINSYKRIKGPDCQEFRHVSWYLDRHSYGLTFEIINGLWYIED